MDKIIIENQTISETSKQEVSDLAFSLQKEFNSEILSVKYNQRGYAVTWWEVINIWLPAGGLYLAGKVVERVVEKFLDWAEKKMEAERAEKDKKNVRPKCIVIYGPDGKPVKSVVVYENGEKNVKTKTELQEDPLKPPPKDTEQF